MTEPTTEQDLTLLEGMGMVTVAGRLRATIAKLSTPDTLDGDAYLEAIGSAIDDDLGWANDADREAGDYPGRIRQVAAELRALRAAPVYPDTIPNAEDGPQRVMQPSPSVHLEVSPSGFIECWWDQYSPRYPYNRKVRYVLAAPNEGDADG